MIDPYVGQSRACTRYEVRTVAEDVSRLKRIVRSAKVLVPFISWVAWAVIGGDEPKFRLTVQLFDKVDDRVAVEYEHDYESDGLHHAADLRERLHIMSIPELRVQLGI